jgi:hypothetical protein
MHRFDRESPTGEREREREGEI